MPVPGTLRSSTPRRQLVPRDRLVDRLRSEFSSMPRLVLVSAPAGFGVEALLVRPLAHRARGDLDAALADLGRSLRAAVPEGYGRLFVDEGPAARELLRTLASRLGLPGSPEAAALLQATGAQHDRGTARLATVDRAGPAQQA